MIWTRSFLVWSAIAGCTMLVVVACGDEDGAPRDLGTTDASPDVASQPDASPADAGARPDADARAPFDPADEPVTCAGLPCAVQIVAGDDHFCARMSDGTVRCWGSDNLGALGRGSGEDADAGPDAGWAVSAVAGLSGVTQLSAAGATTCARVEEASAPGEPKIACWGSNEHGQLGLGDGMADFDPHPEPVAVALSRDAKPVRVDVGHRSACAVLPSGAIACWGNNEQLQLARTGGEPVLGPAAAEIGQLLGARTVPAAHSTLVVTPSGEVWSWGALATPFGTVGGRIASVSPDPLPGRVGTLAGVTGIAVSGWIEDFESPEPLPPRAHACAIASGEVYCWGQTYRAALCTGVPDSSRTPAHAPSYTAAWPQQIAVSDELTCVRMTDGTVSCCGEDGRGRLGRGKVGLYEKSFVRASAFEGKAVQVAASNGAVCVLVQGGTVECWGSNENGELGQPDVDALPHPSPLVVRF